MYYFCSMKKNKTYLFRQIFQFLYPVFLLFPVINRGFSHNMLIMNILQNRNFPCYSVNFSVISLLTSLLFSCYFPVILNTKIRIIMKFEKGKNGKAGDFYSSINTCIEKSKGSKFSFSISKNAGPC